MLTLEETQTNVKNNNEGNAGNQILWQSESMEETFTKGLITFTD